MTVKLDYQIKFVITTIEILDTNSKFIKIKGLWMLWKIFFNVVLAIIYTIYSMTT